MALPVVTPQWRKSYDAGFRFPQRNIVKSRLRKCAQFALDAWLQGLNASIQVESANCRKLL
jgi:hypothetical protein